jgi:SNF family Na+-dependent transporter
MVICTIIIIPPVYKGIKFFSKAVVIISCLLVIVLLILLGEGVKLDRDVVDAGIKKQWQADWGKLGTVKIWRDAVS